MIEPALELILDGEHYARLVGEVIPAAQRFVWIATADVKDLYIAVGSGRTFRPFLGLLAELVGRGVAVRLLHAKEPGPRFRADFDRFPTLIESDLFERGMCPRLHSKIIIVDGRQAYVGSANLTGAGLGAKGAHRRNFEAGVLLSTAVEVRRLMNHLDALWLGQFCGPCERRAVCADPLDLRGD